MIFLTHFLLQFDAKHDFLKSNLFKNKILHIEMIISADQYQDAAAEEAVNVKRMQIPPLE